ncbi:cytochrome P450 [Luteimonas sp. S4-F44]|uniref:cytochrome P450 n=1 Tax=Luteimonas sp. S4-F44 TaxID=2925842 RepID=UPI001F52D996|nr:cytochrome P450 [Luteimonas sp. S4-F44]UNK41818.1 cytochrome P450 [Luteimonas sp. S4-F44]
MPSFKLPADPAFWQNPAPFFHAALDCGAALFDAGGGAVAVLGHPALFALARDARADGHPLAEDHRHPEINRLLRWGLFLQTAPMHRPLRNAVVAGLSASRVDALRPRLATIAADLAFALRSRPAPDLTEHFVRPFVARAFCALCALNEGLADALAEDMTAIAAALHDPVDDGVSVRAEDAAARVLQLLRDLEHSGTSALLSDMAARIRPSCDVHAADLAAAFSFDAIETSTGAIACALDVLLREAGLARALSEGRWTLDAVVQEAFRVTSPTLLTVRMARDTIPLDGTRIDAGTTLVMWWASANLDARAYPRPGVFDPVRGARGHLAFGGGAHACLGRRLATMLTEEALRALRLAPGPRLERVGQTVYLPRLGRMPREAPLKLVYD